MRKLGVFFFVFLFLLSISIVSASEYNLDVNAELIDNKVDNLNLDGKIPLEQNIAIRFTIVNNNNLWIKVNNFSISMKANKDGERFFPISSVIDTLIVEQLLIPPQNKAEFYVVLEEYNSLPKNDRIGSWTINFESTQLSSNSFQASDLTKDFFLPLDIIKPNNIEFTVIKEKAYLDENVTFFTKLFSILSHYNLDIANNIIDIIVGAFIILGLISGILKKFGIFKKFNVLEKSGKLKNIFVRLSKIVKKHSRELQDFEKTGKYKDFIEEEEVQDLLAHFEIEGIQISSDGIYNAFKESNDEYDKFKELIGFTSEIEEKYQKPNHSIHSDYITLYRKYFSILYSPYKEDEMD